MQGPQAQELGEGRQLRGQQAGCGERQRRYHLALSPTQQKLKLSVVHSFLCTRYVLGALPL